jgi:hypothetical protein
LQFDSGAPGYTFNFNNAYLSVTGAGIVNSSSNAITTTTSGYGGFIFQNAASAGAGTLNVGDTYFNDTSTGGTATINARGNLGFIGASSVGQATVNVLNTGYLTVLRGIYAGIGSAQLDW